MMDQNRITVCGRIDEVLSSAPKQKVVRDYASEKQVKQELREKLEKDGTYEGMTSAEFHSLYQKKLRSYGSYIDAYYVARDAEDGEPGLLISKGVWENELRITYSVDNESYTQNVTYCTETDCLESGDDFYVTVDRDQPQMILRKSIHDYRTEQERKDSDDSGCLGPFIIALLVLIALYFASGGMS